MAHYAFIDENNIVTEVIVGIDENELIEGLSPEEWYSQFRNQSCIRTSYNGKIRGTFASIGYFYDQEKDIFVVPQPFSSWKRNGSFWVAPKARPQTEIPVYWDEEKQDWIEI